MEYTGPIIDAHHHFWEPILGKQPWLGTEVLIPFRYGDYSSIKTSYLPPHLKSDAQDLNIIGSVTMETEWEVTDPVGEMIYTHEIGKRFDWPLVSVAHAVLKDPKVEQTLEELAEFGWVRSVRNKPGQSDNYASARPEETLLTDARWIKGFSLLKKYDLAFDLQVPWWHFPQAGELIRKNPDQVVVINHAGLPSDRSEEALGLWKDNIIEIAQYDNVVMKLSGIGVPNQEWTLDNNRFIMQTLADYFTPQRLIAASNFPVDRLVGSYQQIFGAYLEFTNQWSYSDQYAFFAGSAARTYGIKVDGWLDTVVASRGENGT